MDAQRGKCERDEEDAGGAAGRSVGERLNAATDRLRLTTALERLSKLEARLGTLEDQELRGLGAVDAVLSSHHDRIAEIVAQIEAGAIKNTAFYRLRWLFLGR